MSKIPLNLGLYGTLANCVCVCVCVCVHEIVPSLKEYDSQIETVFRRNYSI